MNHMRGHETKQHRQLKLIVAGLLSRLGYEILFEQKGCDVVGIKQKANGTVFMLGAEVQLNNKNTCRNINRDLSNGVNAVLVVTTSDRLKASIETKLSRELDEAVGNLVEVAVIPLADDAAKRIL